ncbi:PREDICTED: uncharacterized protein LOC105575317 [Cercocebus atys]|uniref:uncharacterized protein LOC105575317 n=1 Tax=Cercocebus atys TaxID=9531 RepID=UPI0005F3D4C5|nr:PREDICTED: uncharacterized protein LOC105575317 [Cercocebus atys]
MQGSQTSGSSHRPLLGRDLQPPRNSHGGRWIVTESVTDLEGRGAVSPSPDRRDRDQPLTSRAPHWWPHNTPWKKDRPTVPPGTGQTLPSPQHQLQETPGNSISGGSREREEGRSPPPASACLDQKQGPRNSPRTKEEPPVQHWAQSPLQDTLSFRQKPPGNHSLSRRAGPEPARWDSVTPQGQEDFVGARVTVSIL